MDLHIPAISFLILILGTAAWAQNTTTVNATEVAGEDTKYVRLWGPWTEWSVCGQSCGYGTQYRIRRCHRLTENKTCYGATKQFKICNMKPCPSRHQDYRSRECSKHDHIFYGSRRYRWRPYINDQSPCELSCKSVGQSRYYARFKTTVDDGVICNDENTASCIQGECLVSGCDGILGSGSKEDVCGVCGGKGDSCRIISGIYTRTHLAKRGYNLVVTIPAGARAINISEIGRSKNHLALATSTGYFLNGHLRLQALGTVKGVGTVFDYKRGWRHGCRGECLTADGPTDTAVRVELIYFGRNPGITYTYAVSNSEVGQATGARANTDSDDDDGATVQVKKAPTYIANKLPYAERQQLESRQQKQAKPTRDPFRIIRHRKAKIVSRQKPQIVARTRNQTHRKSSSKKQTKVIKMTPSQKAYPFNKKDLNPSPPVNDTGDVHYRHYYHTNALDGLGDVPKATTRGRDGSSYRNSWKGQNEAWPVEAGNKKDKQKQIASSSSSFNDNTIPQPQPMRDSSGNSINNNNITDNNVLSQPDYRPVRRGRTRSRLGGAFDFVWRISGFTECTEPCGGGLQQTRVVCIKADSQVEVMDEDCDVTAKPEPTTVVCNNEPCKANWAISQWTACSVTCGRGLRNREVKCEKRISPTLTIPMSSTTCPSPRPQSRQFCQLDPCYKWKPSNWTKCSTVCGFGQRTRTLKCLDTLGKEVKKHLCTQVKPSVDEICDMGSCAQGWFHSRWNKECSVDCGRGSYARRVYCSAPDGSPLDENKCEIKSKPRETKSCRKPLPCGGQWFAGPWSKCNDTCGTNAVRHREVLCVKQHGKRVRGVVKDHNCDESKTPSATEPCLSLPPCSPQWYMMAWSECSKSCDTGARTREVTCLDHNLNPSPDCDVKSKPSVRQSCNIHACEQNFAEFSGSNKGGKTQILQQDGTIIEVPACEDKNGQKWCRLVSQARLCSYPVYQDLCCQSCRQPKSKG